MKRVFVYYECNYNDLADDCGACSDIYVFSNIAKAKNQVTKTLKIHVGTGITDAYYEGCDRFVVYQNQLEDAGIIVNENEKLTDEQIDIFIENVFKDGYCNICLFADEQENWDEYFTIHVDEAEIK